MKLDQLNICIVTTCYPPEDGGGIGTYTRNLAEGLVELGQRVSVIAQTTGPQREETVRGVTLYRLRQRHLPKLEKYLTGLSWSVLVARQVQKIAKDHGLDVVEFPNWEGPGFSYSLWPGRIPTVSRLHTPFFETLQIDTQEPSAITIGDRFTCWLEKSAVQRSDHLLCSTRHHRMMMSQAYGLEEGRINILPLGIPLPAFSTDEHEIKSGDRRRQVLYVSRLEKRKGTLTLIEAIPQVLARIPEVEFLFVGKDRPHAPGGKTYTDYFAKNFGQHQAQVKFLGFVSDEELERFYRQCDLFVVPSLYESFGLIYLEAMAYGKPVIGGDAGGMPEVIAHEKTGFTLPAERSDLLAGKIVELLENDALRLEMGRQARAHVERRFSARRMAENSLAFYQHAIIEN